MYIGQAYTQNNLSSMGLAFFNILASNQFGIYIYALLSNKKDVLDNKKFYYKI